MASIDGSMFFSNIYANLNILHDNPLYFAMIGDKGMITVAYHIDTHEACSGSGP
jgi:hypothetical protein